MAAPAAPAGAVRYLYVVGCDGVVDKVDTSTGRTLKRQDVAATLPIAHAQTAAGATFDGCLMNQALYVPAARAFFTVAPDQFSDKPDGTKDYHVFSISIPGLRAAPVAVAGEDLTEAPRIVTAGAGVRVEPEPPTDADLDLSTFAGSGPAPGRAQVLASSGDRALVRAPTAGLVLAVADFRTKSLTRLAGLPHTTARLVHLGPGGTRVYVEEASEAGGAKTGGLFVYDAKTGRAPQDHNRRPHG